MWLLHALDPSSAAYNVCLSLRIHSEVDPAAIRRSFQRIYDRHATLRATFELRGERLLQSIAGPGPVPFEAVEVKEWESGGVLRAMHAAAQRPFDLRSGPVFRVVLFHGGPEQALVVCAHHIVMDMWSTVLLLEELGRLYPAELRGEPATLPAPELEYAEYTRWQEEMLRGPEGGAHESYWRARLAGELPDLELSTDRPRPPMQSLEGETVRFHLESSLTNSLRALARAERTTLFTVLLAAYQAFLHRHTGQKDLVVGTPVAARAHAAFESVVGLFVNTLPMRADFSDDPPFRVFLARSRQAVLGGLEHQDFPFPVMVERLHPARDSARSPVFQTMFSFERPHRVDAHDSPAFLFGEGGARRRLGGLDLETLTLDLQGSQLDLTLTVHEVAGGLNAAFEFCTALFERATIERMAGQFRVLLCSIAANPDARVSQISLLPAEERARIRPWEDGGAPAGSMPPHEAAWRAARRSPRSPAIVAAEETISYADLRARAAGMARRLRAAGVGPGSVVALLAPRSPQMIAGMLGVLQAGAAYLPVDPSLPPSRIRSLMDAAKPAVILAGGGRLPPDAGPGAVVLELAGTLDESDETEPGPGPDPEQPACVIFTSGTSGSPKGVVLPHRALANHAAAIVQAYRLTARDRVLHFASPAFDVAAEEIFPTLAAGAAIVVREDGEVPSFEDLDRLLTDGRVTVVNLPASYWRSWILELDRRGGSLPPELRLVVAGSETLPAAALGPWRRLARGRVRLLNAYGPTETAITATLHEVASTQPDVSRDPDAVNVAIGRPLPGVRVRVVDSAGEAVGIGVPGEAVIGGRGVALGYLDRADETAERFVPDRGGDGPAGWAYRTGDRVRWRPDGELEFLGRLDDQLKIRGFRVEPAEIEHALQAHPFVAEAAVAALRDAGGRARLVAWYVARRKPEDGAEHRADVEPLASHLASRLPEYMVPSEFRKIESLPRTPGGKLDRRALVALGGESSASAVDLPPRTALERSLARIWADLLHLPSVGVHQNFFALGGDSILALQVVSRARQLGVPIASRQIFQHPTVAALAAAAEEAAQPDTRAAEVGDPHDVESASAPLTPIQRWFFELESPEPHHDNQSVMLRLREPPDAAALERAIQTLVDRHDALRLRFERGRNGWRQWTVDSARIPLEWHDLSSVPADLKAARRAAMVAGTQAGLDLSSGPIVRAALFDHGPGEDALLLLVVHHLAIDGVSWRILLEELSDAYRSVCAGREPAAFPAPSFLDRARRLARYARTEAARVEAEYWRAQIGGASASLAPWGRSQGNDPSEFHRNLEGARGSVTIRLEADETRALLLAGSDDHRSGMQELILGALLWAIRAWSGDGPRRVDLEGHGRSALEEGEDLSSAVGWFTAIYPVRFDLGEARSAMEAVSVVRRTLRAVPRGGIGYGVLRYSAEDPALAAGLAEGPPSDVCFNYLGQFDSTLLDDDVFAFAEEPLGEDRSPRARRSHLFEVNAFVSGGRLTADLSYGATLHGPEAVAELARLFRASLKEVVGAHAAAVDADRGAPSTTDAREEDIVQALAPMQQGMLFHTLRDAEPGSYVEQMSWTFEGDLDVAALRTAWDRIAERHAVFRTAVLWQGTEHPVQLVRRSADLPWDILDWRELETGDQEARLEEYLAADRARPFTLERAPLARFALVRLAADRWHFIWTHHHLILDGWSVPLVLDELATTYESLCHGREAALPAVRPYRDYLEWLAGRDPDEAAGFWRARLEGVREPLRLPVEGPGVGSGRGAAGAEALDATWSRIVRRLPPATTSALERFARDRAVTLGTLVSAAWAILLARLTRRDDVLFGTVLSGRPEELAGSHRMVGLFINTLPLRLEVPAERPLADWLLEVQARRFELLRHQHVPLAQVQQWSEVSRGQPLFETLVVFENYPAGSNLEERFGNARLRDLRAWDKTNYPVTVAASPGESLSLQIVYAADRFSDAAMRDVMEWLALLLESMPQAGEDRVCDLPMLDSVTRDRVRLWSGERGCANANPEFRYPERSIHALFEEQVARHPGAVALSYRDQTMTYGELDHAAETMAGVLASSGAGPGRVTAICMDRAPEVVVAMLAILKTGGCYLPLDPAYPPARLEFMLRDSGARCVLTRVALAGRLFGAGARVVILEDVARLPATDAPRPAKRAETAPDDPAYMMYTSGSTGEPRGVVVPHRGVVRMVRDTDWLRIDETDVVLQVVSLAFDPSALEIWSCLLNGARLVLHPSARPTLEEIGEVLRAERVTMAVLITGLFPLMVEERLQDLLGLRQLIVGGDVMPPETARRLLAAAPGLRLIDAYGPTEGTVVATAHAMTDPSQVEAPVPIGRPIANTRTYVLDRHGQLAPPGIPGEILIAGDGVALGYHGRPDRTAERFVRDPFGPPGSRAYRTGDLGRWRDDGTLEFLGRVDEQVKVRGFRVEPGEIESALRSHPAVKGSVVAARRDPRGDLRLVAYVVISGEESGTIADLRQHLRDRLPEFMVPSVFVPLSGLPLTANGKVDRASLPDPSPAAAETPRSAEPWNAIEEEVGEVWMHVVQCERPGLDEDFFEAGGHSLLAIRVVSRLRARLGAVVELRDLYDTPTVRGLSARIERRLTGAGAEASDPGADPPQQEPSGARD